jgi:hypothetical protein
MSYRSVLVGEAAEYAPEASFALSPIFGGVGIDPNVELWLGAERTFGVDARLFLRGYRLAVGSESFTAAPIDLQVNARLKLWNPGGDWSAYAGVGFHRSAAQLFAYTDDTMQKADVVNKALLGGRISGGIRGEWDRLLLQAELAETFAPFPVITRIDALADVPLGWVPVDLTFGTALEARHATFNIVSDAAKMRVRQLGWELRAGVMFPLP